MRGHLTPAARLNILIVAVLSAIAIGAFVALILSPTIGV